jgi:hypothetical protein
MPGAAEIIARNALKSLRPARRFSTNSQRMSGLRAVFTQTEIVALKSLRQFFCDGYFTLTNHASLRVPTWRYAHGYYNCKKTFERSCYSDGAF